MPDYKLTYFDFDGGRGEPIRIAFHAAGIEFEDHRVNFEEFGKLRGDLPFRAVPVLYIDGEVVTQSNALTRHVGRLAGLYPDDALQALYCDEVIDAVEDLTHRVAGTLGLEGDELKAAREHLAKGWLPVFLEGLGGLLERGGDYFADGRLTIADLKMFPVTRWLSSGTLEHIPTDIVERLAPALITHLARVEADPVVAGYYASR
jgi:glutathione S-transferase